jgi:hypothetical protein
MAYRRDDRYAGNWYVKNGRLVVKRLDTGQYEHETGGSARGQTNKFARFIISRIENDTADGQRNPSAGFWTYRREDAAPGGLFCTKAEAVKALQAQLYGDWSLEPDENI